MVQKFQQKHEHRPLRWLSTLPSRHESESKSIDWAWREMYLELIACSGACTCMPRIQYRWFSWSSVRLTSTNTLQHQADCNHAALPRGGFAQGSHTMVDSQRWMGLQGWPGRALSFHKRCWAPLRRFWRKLPWSPRALLASLQLSSSSRARREHISLAA